MRLSSLARRLSAKHASRPASLGEARLSSLVWRLSAKHAFRLSAKHVSRKGFLLAIQFEPDPLDSLLAGSDEIQQWPIVFRVSGVQ